MLTITQFHGGHANNVMPDECWLDGSIRCYSNEVFKIAHDKILQIADSTASLFGCTSTVTFYESYPAVVNTPEHTAAFQAFASALLGPHMVTSEGLPIPASEDFSYFLQERPGCFFFLGTGQADAYLHTSQYDYRDEMVGYGAHVWVSWVIERLGAK